MAKDPFQQLRVIRNVSRKKRPIYDCYRLLYNPKLLNNSYDRLGESNKITKSSRLLKNLEITKLINRLRMGKFRFNTSLHRFTDQWMCITLEICLREILIPRFSENAFPQFTKDTVKLGIKRLKSNYIAVAWCLQLRIKTNWSAPQRQILIERLSSFIYDRRFLLLLHNYFKNRNPAIINNLDELLFSFYLTLFDEEISRVAPAISFLRFHNKIIIYHPNRNYLNKILERLTYFLKNSLLIQPYLVDHKIVTTRKGIQMGNIILKFYHKKIKIEVTKQGMINYAKKYGYGNFEKFIASPRGYLANRTEEEILAVYLKELNNVRNTIYFANDKKYYKKLYYLAKQSYLKTLALKKQSSVKKIYLFLEKNPTLKFSKLNELSSF